MSDDLDRQHAASARRRGQFAEKGQIARSRELMSAMVLAGGTWLITKQANEFTTSIVGTTRLFLTELDKPLDASFVMAFGACFLRIVVPVCLIGASCAILSALFQHRGSIPFRTPSIDFSRIDIPAKLMQLFAPREALINIGSLLLKVAVLGTIFYVAAKDPLLSFVSRVPVALGPGLSEAGVIFMMILKRGIAVSLILGVLDFALTWWRTEQRMKMSTQEVREEAKDQGGDASVKSRRKKMAREIMQKRALNAVPKADVVLVNPTHVAVAILYDDKKMDAPVVVAKGGDQMAERIRSIARRHGVPVVSQPPLARLLFARVEVGEPVPNDVYQAVAIVLAHCYRLRRRAA